MSRFYSSRPAPDRTHSIIFDFSAELARSVMLLSKANSNFDGLELFGLSNRKMSLPILVLKIPATATP